MGFPLLPARQYTRISRAAGDCGHETVEHQDWSISTVRKSLDCYFKKDLQFRAIKPLGGLSGR